MAKKPEVPEINWELITPELIKAFTPFIQAFTWLGLTKVDPKVNALNNLIAIAAMHTPHLKEFVFIHDTIL